LNEARQGQPPKQPPTAGVQRVKTAKEVGDEGFRFSEEGHWEMAIQKYREAISMDPAFGLAYRNLGYALNRVGQFKEAVEVLTKAVSLTTQDAPLHRIYDLLGFSKMSLKDYAGAVADFTSSLKYSANDPRVLIHRAEAHAQVGEFSKALQDLNRALRLEPANRHAIRLKTRLEAEGKR
jgi:serine/threonine-protein kinase